MIYCCVKNNYLDRRGRFIDYFDRRDTRRGTFDNPLNGPIGVVFRSFWLDAVNLVSKLQRGTRAVSLNYPVST